MSISQPQQDRAKRTDTSLMADGRCDGVPALNDDFAHPPLVDNSQAAGGTKLAQTLQDRQ